MCIVAKCREAIKGILLDHQQAQAVVGTRRWLMVHILPVKQQMLDSLYTHLLEGPTLHLLQRILQGLVACPRGVVIHVLQS